jgi:uncharacterized protein YlaI
VDVPWQYQRCILCLTPAELTEEHIIPRQIGGKLTAHFLCKPCNDRLGADVESLVKRDHSVRLAVGHLKDQVPGLAQAILRDQPYVASGEGVDTRGRFVGSTFRVDSRRNADGSLIQPTPDARQSLARMLAKRGLPTVDIDAALARFDGSPLNQMVQLAPGLEAVKWRIDRIEPSLEGPALSEPALLKIAYEFFACHMGELVYDESPQLAALRAGVFAPALDTTHVTVDYFTTREYSPLHTLSLHGRPHAVVNHPVVWVARVSGEVPARWARGAQLSLCLPPRHR